MIAALYAAERGIVAMARAVVELSRGDIPHARDLSGWQWQWIATGVGVLVMVETVIALWSMIHPG